MEKPGIEPATPGLQGIALIHYTTGASLETLSWGGGRYAKSAPGNTIHVNLRKRDLIDLIYNFIHIYQFKV